MCYLYLSYLSTVIQFTLAAQENYMLSQGWYKDNASNSGFEAMQAPTKDSKSFELMGPLFLNFFLIIQHP